MPRGFWLNVATPAQVRARGSHVQALRDQESGPMGESLLTPAPVSD